MQNSQKREILASSPGGPVKDKPTSIDSPPLIGQLLTTTALSSFTTSSLGRLNIRRPLIPFVMATFDLRIRRHPPLLMSTMSAENQLGPPKTAYFVSILTFILRCVLI